VVSTAAGLLVSKSGVDGAADEALVSQLSGYPKALGMSSVVMLVMSVLPGIPMIPFLALAGTSGGLAWYAERHHLHKAARKKAMEVSETKAAQPKEEPISKSLRMDELKLELGYALLALIKDPGGDSDKLTDQIKALRRQLASEQGFIMPSVRMLDNMQLGGNEYVIKVKEVEAGHGTIYPDLFMVMDPAGGQIELAGTHTKEPAFGLPATWIEAGLRDQAALKGYTVVDPVTVMSTHLTEILKSNMAELLSYAEVQKLLDELPEKQKKLVDDLIPGQINVTGVQRVLQSLLGERVSIRDLPTILEGISEATGYTKHVPAITEHVRSRLARQICASHMSAKGYLPLVTLAPKWEQDFAESIVGQGEDRQLAMAPSRLQEFIAEVRAAFEQAGQEGEVPVLLTSPGIRPFVRTIIERFRPQTTVLSQNEIHPQAKLRTVGQI